MTESSILEQQLFAYAKELRELRRRERATEAQASRYAGELRRVYLEDLGAARDRKRKEARVNKVIAEDLYVIVFQPIVELSTKVIRGYEALSRFSAEPPRTPDVWFDEAAEVGLAPRLELGAVRKACVDSGPPADGTYFSVNVSPSTLLSSELSLATEDLPLDRIVFEVTEHAPVRDYGELSSALAPLRARGARLAVDDVGAGFASLRHILFLQPDILKLDASLTHDVDVDAKRQALARALITFAQGIGAAIVAEGIETNSEASTLHDLGAQYGQGYLLGRPGPLFPPDQTP